MPFAPGGVCDGGMRPDTTTTSPLLSGDVVGYQRPAFMSALFVHFFVR